jgi:phosphoserine phosphatase RsbU/P
MGTAALWLAVFAVIDAVPLLNMISMFAVAPLIVATAAGERITAIFSGAAVVLALTVVMWDHVPRDGNYWVRVAAIGIIGVMAVVLAGLRRRREERLVRMSAIAQASQLALLPPLPPEMTGINIAARYRSATRDAAVGGDLYEIIPTRHGIRVIIGDVRGKGLDAVMLARQVLSAFRRSAVARPALEQVAGEVSRVIKPHLGEEDFVTAALAEITPGGDLTIVNCGHHPPLLRHAGALESLTDGTTDLPLGLEENFAPFTARWSPGDRLLLYTDGLVESRDHHGDFLPEDEIAAALLASGCEQALDALMKAVHRYTGGQSHDDIALLLLEHGASPRAAANGHPVKAAAEVVGPLSFTGHVPAGLAGPVWALAPPAGGADGGVLVQV